MEYSCEPLDGWPAKDVEMTQHGPATSDIYGRLFTYLRSVLKHFMSRIEDKTISFQLIHHNASDLLDQLKKGSFDRIEVRLDDCVSTVNLHSSRYPIFRTSLIWASISRSP